MRVRDAHIVSVQILARPYSPWLEGGEVTSRYRVKTQVGQGWDSVRFRSPRRRTWSRFWPALLETFVSRTVSPDPSAIKQLEADNRDALCLCLTLRHL